MQLEFDHFTPDDLRDLDPARRERALGWFQGSNRGFHLRALDEDAVRAWLERSVADRATLRGAWLPAGSFGAGAMPVATLSSWAGDLNTGERTVELHMVSDVTVAPSHRRQGLASRLLVEDLHAAADAGLALAGLTVSEGGIYRRFGFGPATFAASYRVDVTSRFALEHPTTVGGAGRSGRVVQLEPVDAWPVVQELFGRWHAATRGSVSRHAAYEAVSTGLLSSNSQGPVPELRAAVHLDDADRPDGYVLFTHSGIGSDPLEIRVRDLVALAPSAHVGLWEYLAGSDLTDRVQVTSHVDDPLRWALRDPRCVEQTSVEDHLWLRPLDLPAAVAARPWQGEGSVVLGVDDPIGFVDGTWRLEVSGGEGTLTRTDAEPEVRLGCEAFGSLYLGAVDVETLVLAGRVRGEAAALARFAGFADGGPRPFCRTHF